MTFDDVLTRFAAELDDVLTRNRLRFWQSLIDNQCPPEDIEGYLAYEREHMRAWRERRLAEMAAQLESSGVTVH